MFKAKSLLFAGLIALGGFAPLLAFAAKSCNESFSELLPSKILHSDPEYVAHIQKAFQKELQKQKDTLESDLKGAVREAQAECKDAKCFEEKLIKKSQIEERVQLACPINSKKASGPIIQQVRNLAIGLSALGVSYTAGVGAALKDGKEIPDYPFDITASVITLSLWRTWVMCKNEYSPSAKQLPWAKRAWKNFAAYQKVILFGNFIYIGFVASEDWTRGEDITSAEKLKAYGTEFVVSYVWDQAFAGLGVVVIDPFFKRLPDLAPLWASRIGRLFNPATNTKLVNLNDKNFLFVKVGNPLEIFGMVADYGTRWSLSASRSWIWLEVRKLIGASEDNALENP